MELTPTAMELTAMLPTPTAMELTTPSERGLLMLSLLLMPMPTMVDTTVLEPTDTPDLDTDPMAMLPTPTAMELTAMLPTPTAMELTAMLPTSTAMELTTPSARGLLMLSPPLMPMPTMVDTTVLEPTDTPDLDTDPMELTPTAMELTAMLPTPTAMELTTPSARGLLMLSPPLMPMPTMVDTTDMVD